MKWANTLATAYGERGLKGVVSVLGRLQHLAVHLGAAGLVEADRPVRRPDGLQHPQGAHRRGLRGELGHLEAHLDVALGTQVVDLGGLDPVEVADQAGDCRSGRA